MRVLFKLRILLIIGSTATLMIGFQNCSKYQYTATDMAGSPADSGSNGLNTDTLPDGSTTQVNQPPVTQPPTEVKPPVVVLPPTEVKPPVVVLPPTDIDKECKEFSTAKNDDGESEENDEEKDSEERQSKSGKSSVAGNCSDKREVKPKPIVNKCYINVEDDDDEKDLEKHCNKEYLAKSSHNNLNAAAVDIKHRRGKLVITQDNIEHINSIEDFRGKLILCGVSVDRVSNTRGKIVLVDSQIEEMEDHKGNIKIIGNSSCKNVVNSDTQIEVNRRK